MLNAPPLKAIFQEDVTMVEEKVKNNISYVFINYQLKKLLEKGLITKAEAESAEKHICMQLGADYKYSCNVM